MCQQTDQQKNLQSQLCLANIFIIGGATGFGLLKSDHQAQAKNIFEEKHIYRTRYYLKLLTSQY